MPLDLKQFAGIMNTDDDPSVIPPLHHAMAMNIRFRGTGNNLRVENVPGTTLITNPLLPSGTNECIGAFYDTVRQRIYWFNYNSNGNHGIYIYYTQTQTIAALLVVGSATDGDILGFTLDRPIVSVNVVYGGTTSDGDIILFIDSLKRPTGFNVDRYLNSPYAITKRAFIDVAKAPFVMPPKCTYENDYSIAVNNMRNALFQFKARPVYDDNQKSVYGPASKVALPVNPFDQAVSSQTSQNGRISIYVQTGDVDVKKIEIWGRQSTDTTKIVNNNSSDTPDYFLIISLDKAQLSIPDNSIYRFLFFNDGVYNAGSLQDEVQLYDYVPPQANCQETLNGNTPAYAGITEGYPNTQTDIAISTANSISIPTNQTAGVLFLAQVNGLASGGVGARMTVYLTGAGPANDGSGNPLDLPITVGGINGITLKVSVTLPDGTDKSFSYLTASNDINLILGFLGAAAVAQGFTIVSTGPYTGANPLILSFPSNIVLCSSSAVPNGDVLFATQPYYAYSHKAAYDFAIGYADEKGRFMGGAQPSTNNPITTLEDLTGLTIPTIQLTVRHRPPIAARSWFLLRSSDLTYGTKKLGWACNQTFTNTDPNDSQKYAYIGISNMVDYNQNIEAATPVVQYDFAQGDRIRFEIRYPIGVGQVYLTTGLDFEITAVEENPVLNGVTQLGRFIKILYPASQITANFDFGGDAFQHYKILVYNYALRLSSATTIFNEFGEQYGIGNAGTLQAYHMGLSQTQSADLSTPAIVITGDGDYFYRQRIVPAGMIYYLSVDSNPYVNPINTFGVLPDTTPIITSAYTLKQQIAGPLASGSGGNQQFLFTNLLPQPFQLRLTVAKSNPFTLQVGANKVATVDIIVTTSTTVSGVLSGNQYLIKRFFMGIGENVQSYDASFDGYATVPVGQGAWFAIVNRDSPGSSVRNGSFILKFQALDNIPITVIESSFSDKYNIVTNSNGRPWLYDENAAQKYYPNMIRWGLAYQQGTNLNNMNRFYFQNQDFLDLGRGDIQRMKARDRIIRFFQNRGCCEKGIYNTFVKTSSGEDILTTTNVIITPNNVKYYEGEYGMGTNFTGLVSGKIQDYFADVVRGYWVRLSQDGLIPVSELYKGEYYIRSLITPYNNSYTRADGGPAFIYGYYDYLEEECHFIFRAGTNSSGSIAAYNLSFNEKRNAFTGFYDFQPEWACSAEEDTYSWLAGQLYIHNNTASGNYTKFYGVAYSSSIKLVFNIKSAFKKKFLDFGFQANQYWECPVNGDVLTSDFNPQTGLQQISQFIAQDLDLNENQFFGAILRDANSGLNPVIAVLEGDFLLGIYISMNFTYRGNNFGWLYAPYVTYKDSPKNF